MKNFIFKSLLATCVAGIAIVCTPKSSVAQVDISLLTEVASSCQKDVYSSEYYNNKLGLSIRESQITDKEKFYRRDCITSRYFYSQILSQFPWLVSAGEILPGYPGSVAVSEIAGNMAPHNYVMAKTSTDASTSPSAFLDCLSTLDSGSEECGKGNALRTLYFGHYINSSEKRSSPDAFKSWICPSCFVAYNNNPSGRKMLGSFMEWFMALEPSQRKELMFVLGDNQAQGRNRVKMREEAYKATQEYNAIRERIAREQKEQRRRNLFE